VTFAHMDERGKQEDTILNGNLLTCQIDGEECQAQIHDSKIESTDCDLHSIATIKQESIPLERAFSATFYPDVTQVTSCEKLRTQGMLDLNRLPFHKTSEAIFKRQTTRKKVDRYGNPVICLLIDGSGSFNQKKMQMTKILSTT